MDQMTKYIIWKVMDSQQNLNLTPSSTSHFHHIFQVIVLVFGLTDTALIVLCSRVTVNAQQQKIWTSLNKKWNFLTLSYVRRQVYQRDLLILWWSYNILMLCLHLASAPSDKKSSYHSFKDTREQSFLNPPLTVFTFSHRNHTISERHVTPCFTDSHLYPVTSFSAAQGDSWANTDPYLPHSLQPLKPTSPPQAPH